MISRHTVFAGAGCGKTTRLIALVEELLAEGMAPSDIMFTTFTRAGAYEARDRACAKFGLDPSALPFFKTLHALCYMAVGSKHRMMTDYDWMKVASSMGVFLTRSDEAGGNSKGDRIRAVCELSRVRLIPLEQALQESDCDIELSEFQLFENTLNAYKKAEGKCDFTDLLLEFLALPECPFAPKVIFLDEAQDISPLQWKVVQRMAGNAKVVMAGDDDQCIYRYAGADPEIIIAGGDTHEILPRSYRLPRQVHRLAQNIVARIARRVPKEIACREEDGEIHIVQDLDAIIPVVAQGGSWLFLARNNAFLPNYEEVLVRHGIPFIGGSGNAVREHVLEAVGCWLALQAGEYVSFKRIKSLYNHMWPKEQMGYKRGFKKVVEARKDNDYADLALLRSEFGLTGDGPWEYVVSKDISLDERDYLKRVGDAPLRERPRVEISTIHRAKGREADHVVLAPDVTRNTAKSFERDPDNEHRTWYVGVTRARHSLHILAPRSRDHYEFPV